MADLHTNYYDDILSASMNGKKKFRLTYRNGTTEEVTIEDISEYDQYGSKFGAGDINKTNQAVNEKFDSDDVVDPKLATEEGFAADAKLTGDALSELNKNIDSCFQSVSSGKASVASAITAKGVTTASDATFSTMATNIGKIATTPSTFTSGAVNSSYTISGLTIGKTYILNIAYMQTATSSSYIKSGGTVLKTVSAISSDKYSGINGLIATIMFKATATSVVVQNVGVASRGAWSLIEI